LRLFFGLAYMFALEPANKFALRAATNVSLTFEDGEYSRAIVLGIQSGARAFDLQQ